MSVDDLFIQAADLVPAERAAFLERVCKGDDELHRELESLLAADVPEDGLLQAAVIQAVEHLPVNPDEGSELIGKRVGRYTITSFIGKGGMGAVYRAVREDDFRMQVAVKLLKRGTDTDTALSRFRVERQILAELEHPNIARLLDGGATETGLPYFVMEYVDGTPLLEYVAPLSIRQRIELFRSVCAAVQYAHQNLIVHRDIKPANILVTREGIPKLLDFGVAKLLAPTGEGAATALTATGMRPPMTPAYASPEQVRGELVTTATDVYSLGTVLYELLTGQRAHHIETYSADEIEKEICNREPKRPSAVVRDLDPDLDNVVLMAMRKEPQRRYASVEQFSEDLGRFLHDLPLQARKESLPYRSRKFLKRNRALIMAAAAGAVMVLALNVGSHPSYMYNFALDKASIAVLPFADASPGKDQEYFAEDLTDGLQNMLASISGLRLAGKVSSSKFRNRTENIRVICKKLNVAAILDASTRNQGGHAMINVQLRTADDHQLWSGTYDREVSEIFAVQEEITRAVAAALNLTPPKREMAHLAAMTTTSEAYNNYLQGEYFREQGKVQQAVRYFEQTIKIDPGYAPAWVALGDAHSALAGAAKIPVEEGYGKARDEIERALALNPDMAEAHALIGLIKMLHDRDWTGADASVQRALALAPGNAGVIRIAGLLARFLGRLDQAIVLYRRAVELDPIYSNGYKNLGITLYYAGKQQEAAAALQKALELNPNIAYAHAFLGLVNLAESRPQEGLAEADKEEDSGYHLSVLALAYHAQGKRPESEASLAELIAKRQADFPYQIAEVYAFRGETELAFQWLERAYTQNNDSLPEMKADPLLTNIRRDPRYTALLKKIRLSE